MRATRAHRSADRHFFRAATRADQKEVDQINRSDEQKKKHASLHQQKGWTNRADVLRMQWTTGDRKPASAIIFASGLSFSTAALCASICDCASAIVAPGFKPRDHVRAAAARMALLRRAFLQACDPYRQKETRFRGKEAKIRRQHADDLSRHAVHADVPAEDVRIGIEALPPVGVGQDDDSVVFRRVPLRLR